MRRAFLSLVLVLVASVAARAARADNPFLEVVASGANNPMFVADRGDGTLFVVERAGLIRIASAGTLQDPNDAFLDVTGLVDDEGEGGLLSMAFDPNFATNRRFFIVYTRTGPDPSPLSTVMASYLVNDVDPLHADATTRVELLAQPSPQGGGFTNHKGGTIMFGPVDHMLYFGFGDGGEEGDPDCLSQTHGVLFGKMIRIDPNGTDPNHPNYGIPPDNPFISDPNDGIPDEVWALGLRNPFRFSFDSQTHDLWIGDVGQDLHEEIDMQLAASHGGENYGWNVWEADHCFGGNSNCPAYVSKCTSDQSAHDGYTFPVFQYDHTGSNAVIGGYVYRGSVSAWKGRYVFGDNEVNTIWALEGSQRLLLSQGDVKGPVAFAEDHTGELLVVGLNDGNVYKLRFDLLGLPKAQARCIVKLNDDFAGLANFESSKIRSCIDQGARGKTAVGSCIDADPTAKRRAKIAADDAKLCLAAPPDFGYAGAATGSGAALSSEDDLFDDVFGDPNSIPLKANDRNTVACQESVAKALASCQRARRAEFLRCKAKGLADQTITSADTLAACLLQDSKSAIARACDPSTGAIATRVIPNSCTKRSVDLQGAFPGCNTADPGTLAQCLDGASQCETCNLFNDADGLGTTCSACE